MAHSPASPRRDVALWIIVAAGAALTGALAALAAAAETAPRAAGLTGAFLILALVLGVLAARRLTAPTAQERVAIVGAPAPPYAAVIEAAPDPMLVISGLEPDDVTGRRYILANGAARRMLRLASEAGLLVSAVRAPEVLDAADEALFRGQQAERVFEIAGAQERTYRVLARPLAPGENGARLALLLFRDETEFRQVERTRADFLANASHELRTPLASLSGFIETLRGHARDDAGARDKFLSIMQSQAERMSRLIEDLMSLSRIELNEYTPPDAVVDLSQVAMDVIDALTPLARERSVAFDLDTPQPGEALVIGDRDQLIQVVQNLADNALKYSKPGDVVRVGVQAGLSLEAAGAGQRPDAARLSLLTPDHVNEAYAAIRVVDQGPGIARTHLPRLTERFYRIEGQKSGTKSGTGLGLAIVKHIANRHRGGVVVESLLGGGTTFTAYFPQASAKERRFGAVTAIKLS